MIRKLKVKFITLAMTALFVLLAVVVTAMNIVNYSTVVTEADSVLSILTQNRGVFPDFSNDKGKHPPNMSPETPYESRFFSVLLDKDNSAIKTDTHMIKSVDESTAIAMAKKALADDKSIGFVDEYRYAVKSEPEGYSVVFLDCGRKLDAYSDFLYTSIFTAVAGLVIAFAVIFIFAGKITRPIAEAYDKQKRFITDAGHEMKTPLTVINANVDILETELGENESLSDIAQQTKRLCTLTNDLVMLARMEESEASIQKIEFPVSEVVAEAVQSFKNVAVQQGKHFICNIQPMLSLNGNDKTILQLVNIFLDNALKYCSEGGTVSFSLVKQNRNIYIHAYNTTAAEVRKEQLSRVFDRFYRMDASRNSETGGSGIGLSIAQAIVVAHGGKIQVWTDDGYSFNISAAFPT